MTAGALPAQVIGDTQGIHERLEFFTHVRTTVAGLEALLSD